MALPIIGDFVKGVTDIAGKFIPDKDKLNEFRAAITEKALDYQETILKSQTQVITAEAMGNSWLQRNWRPITMLTFVGLIVATIFGWTAPGLTEVLKEKLFTLVQYGLSGYVVGRSAEKIAAVVAPALGRKKDQNNE